MGSQLFTASGNWDWPAGVTQVVAEAVGGGGSGGEAAGNPSTGGGGKGGGYAKKTITKGAESLLVISIGGGGTAGSNGSPTVISQGGPTVLRATGGNAGASGATNSTNGAGATTSNGTAVGDVTFDGGNGGTGNFTSGVQGSGAGGGAAGPSSVGGNASVNTAGNAGTGTWGDTNTYQGAGAAGVGNTTVGANGNNYGGGGSGGKANSNPNKIGGNGAPGIVLLTWTDPATNYDLIAETGTFSYSGGAAGLSKGYSLTAEAGTFSYAGGNAALSHSPAEPPPIVSQAGFRWYADGTETGSTALAAQNTNYSPNLSGGNVILQLRVLLQSIVAARLTAETGVFSYAGAAANLLTTSRTLLAGAGTFSYTGNNATLSKSSGGSPAFDAATSGTWQTTASSHSFSHTCTGSDLILLVGVGFRGLDNSPAVSGITYAGVALTKIANTNDDSTTGTALRGELWYLIAPATGANNVVVTLTTGTGVVAWAAGAASLTGVHQSSPIGASTMTSEEVGAGSTLSTNLNTSFNNSMVVDYVFHRNDISITAGANQTSRLQTNNGTNVQAMSTEATTTAGTITMSWTGLADNARRHLVVEIKAS